MKHKKEIKNIAIIKNVIIHNKHHNKDYFTKKGILVIEYEDNTRNVLDIESSSDITNCDYWISNGILRYYKNK